MARHASLSPFVPSVDGGMGQEARVFMKQVAGKLAIKWQRSYSEVMGWVQARMSFAILSHKSMRSRIKSEMEKWAWQG